MKHALFNPIATRKEWRISAVALAFVLLAMFGLSSGVAQVKNQKRVTSVRLGSASEGSRVTVVSDSALNDYEAYRRGDRFYVKIPAADFASAVPNFRGTGFEDVQVQKAADSAVISFRLHPGTAARVDQRSNRLDVVFSTPGRSQNAVGTATRATGGAQNSSRGSTEIAAGSTSVATSTPGSLLAPVSPGQPLSSSAATTQGPASPQSVPARGAFLTRWVTRNWLAVLIAALLLGGLAFVFVRRRSSLTGNRRPKQSKEILVQPKNPSDVRLNEPDLFASVEHLTASPLVAVETSEPADLEPLPLAPPSSETTINPSSATPIPPAALEDGFAAEEARLRLQEEALIRAAEELERRRLETKALRKRAEEEAQLKAANEEPARANAEARLRAEGAPRRQAEEEARVKAEIEMRTRAEEEARQRAEEDSRFRLEAETLRRAAEELARRRVAKRDRTEIEMVCQAESE